MTDQVIAAQKLETLSANAANQTIAAQKLETFFNYPPDDQVVAAQKLESAINVQVVQKIAGQYLETLMTFTDAGPPPPPPPVAPPPVCRSNFHPDYVPCIPPPRSRFRRFWATQANVCPPEPGQCNYTDPTNLATECLQPGLQLMITTDPTWQQLTCACDGGGGLPDCAAPITGATINTDNYVAGLVLNILGTNAAQSPSKCGNRPGQRLGYWLDSISGDSSGSSIRYVPTLGFTTNQAVQFVQMQAQADLQKLIKYGVANTVTVTASYVGNGTIALKVVVAGVDDQTTVVNSTMTKISNAWVWNS